MFRKLEPLRIAKSGPIFDSATTVMRLDPNQQEALRDAVCRSVDRSAVVAELERLYADFQSLVDARRPRCDQSGRCCRFDAYGHLLFVTPIELIAFRERLATPTHPWDGSPMSGCAFQVDGMCSVHPARPFGCRVYFCDPTATEWQRQQYESFHEKIKNLHVRHDVPYLYVEWREALKALGWLPTRASESRLRILK